MNVQCFNNNILISWLNVTNNVSDTKSTRIFSFCLMMGKKGKTKKEIYLHFLLCTSLMKFLWIFAGDWKLLLSFQMNKNVKHNKVYRKICTHHVMEKRSPFMLLMLYQTVVFSTYIHTYIKIINKLLYVCF